jgi:WD40 repeat protein
VENCYARCKGNRGVVWALAFNQEGQTLISGGEAAQVKIWQVESGALHENLSRQAFGTQYHRHQFDRALYW